MVGSGPALGTLAEGAAATSFFLPPLTENAANKFVLITFGATYAQVYFDGVEDSLGRGLGQMVLDHTLPVVRGLLERTFALHFDSALALLARVAMEPL